MGNYEIFEKNYISIIKIYIPPSLKMSNNEKIFDNAKVQKIKFLVTPKYKIFKLPECQSLGIYF